MIEAAKQEILTRLQAQAPYPGEKRIYQPVPLCSEREWEVIRSDSEKRVRLMESILKKAGILSKDKQAPEKYSYVDVGCNTGYFCRAMAKLGLRSEGVDVVRVDIEVARMIDESIERTYCNYIVSDAYDYLRATHQTPVDVSSSLSTIQWVMIQKKSGEVGIDCLRWLFQKTRRVCFLEMGYSDEEHYKEKIGFTLDRKWTYDIMVNEGKFDEIVIFTADDHGLKRDFFVGLRQPPQTS